MSTPLRFAVGDRCCVMLDGAPHIGVVSDIEDDYAMVKLEDGFIYLPVRQLDLVERGLA